MLKFFSSTYEEIFGLRYNRFIDGASEAALNRHLRDVDPSMRDTAARARDAVLKRSDRRLADHFGKSARAASLMLVKESAATALSWMGLYEKAKPAAAAISGQEYGFENSFEVFSQWDRIVREHDFFPWRTSMRPSPKALRFQRTVQQAGIEQNQDALVSRDRNLDAADDGKGDTLPRMVCLANLGQCTPTLCCPQHRRSG
jgi:hypothetical protein